MSSAGRPRAPETAGTLEARVRLLPERRTRPIHPQGPVGSAQEAEFELDEAVLLGLWRRSYLERLAHAYWRYLNRASFGLLRVVYSRDARRVVLLHPRLVLLRFRAPIYDTGPDFGQVTWPIERGLLVSAPGRGHLRIAVRRIAEGRLLIRAEVENFYPLLRGRGAFARLGVRFYSLTQLRLHVLITKGFLRSLAQIDLPPSSVGS